MLGFGSKEILLFPITLLVETGSTLTPVQQDANVSTTNGIYEVNLATFTVGTSAISNLQDVAPKAVKIPDALNTLNSNLSNKLDKSWTEFGSITPGQFLHQRTKFYVSLVGLTHLTIPGHIQYIFLLYLMRTVKDILTVIITQIAHLTMQRLLLIRLV